MILPVRFLSILTALLLAFGTLTQATAAGPDSPVSFPTPTPTAEPSTNAPGPGPANPTWPYGYLPIDLAAVVLPESALPNVFYQSGELYLDADRVSNYNYGIPSAEEIAAVGFVQGYTVFFNSNAQSTIRITALLFRDARYMQAAFDLLQDDDRINPNGLMTDGPAVKGAGDAPAETTTGYRENGDGTTTQRTVPTLVPGLSAKAITAGGDHTCALLGDGTAKCWGANADGQLGNGTTVASSSPVAVSGLGGVTALSAGADHSCAVLAAGGLWCWGANATGQLGTGDTTAGTTPHVVQTVTDVTAVSAGFGHTCAVAAGRGWCWGRNDIGQLGDGTTVGRLSPVQVAF